MTLEKNDFIEIEFTGRVKDTNEIFDSNIKEQLEEAGLNKQDAKPFAFALGQGMFLKGVEDFLTGKPSDPAEYKIDLEPESAFGSRKSELVQLMPAKVFATQKINPVPGAVFNFDGKVGKVLSVSGGRVMVDFNNPIAGKQVIYDVKVLRKIDDLNEKIKSFISFLFRRDLTFEVKEDKIFIEVEKAMVDFVKLFEEKFKDLFGLGLEVKETAQEAEKEVKKEAGDSALQKAQDISKEADPTE